MATKKTAKNKVTKAKNKTKQAAKQAKNKAKNMDAKTAAGVGAGVIAAAAAAAAGYYFYGDKNAKKHRDAASKWAKDMKRDVIKEAKQLKKIDIDQKTVARIVDRAAAVYQGVRSVDRKDLRAAADELKHNWTELRREITQPSKKAPAKTGTKKPVARKAAKKKSAKRSS